MKQALLIAGAALALLVGGCSTETNVGSPSPDYETSYGAGTSTKGTYVPGDPTTDPRGGWYDWRYQGLDRSEGHPGMTPRPNNP